MATKDAPVNNPMVDPVTGEYRVIAPGHTFKSVTEEVSRIVLTSHTPLGWYFGFMVAGSVVGILMICLAWLFLKGVGIWAITIPVAWGFAIINFVWWIGIGHAGTLISAILLLFKQSWRNSINRFAEAMTIFAVVCAGMFPLIHVGRPWLGYWLFPYPNTMNYWPQFRSPLLWDVFADSTYATISVVFWYMGMIPDLATPLVLSVHSVISLDFSVALLPGWHTTIFPPYFVAGAIYSGFAMVLTLAIPIRTFYHLEDLITIRHIDNCGKVMLATGMVVAYGYSSEVFMSWYSASHWEYFMMWNRMFGPMGWSYWVLITCNIALPQLMWLRKFRSNVGLMFIMSFIVNTGMWFERFVIVVTSLTRDYLPSSWGTYRATKWDYMTFAGTLGLFTFLFFLFVRFLPMIPMSELRLMLPQAKVKEKPEPFAGTPVPEAGD